MALEPITRQEKIIAGQDLEPITRMEMFLKNFGGGGGGSTGGGLFKVTITGTANETGDSYTYESDKTGREVYDASMNGLLPYAELIVGGEIYFGFVPCMGASDQYQTLFTGVTGNQTTNNVGKILVSCFMLHAQTHNVNYSAHILNGPAEENCKPFSTLYD